MKLSSSSVFIPGTKSGNQHFWRSGPILLELEGLQSLSDTRCFMSDRAPAILAQQPGYHIMVGWGVVVLEDPSNACVRQSDSELE